jgi:hypothetical protein
MDTEQVKTKVLFCSTIKYLNCVETSQQSI